MDLQKIELRYKKVSYHSQPVDLSIDEWQYALRKQYAENHTFGIKNLGDQAVFTDFRITSPESGLSYKVAIRSKDNSLNFCECNDFKTNGLGTCKHIEYALFHIHNKLNKGHLLEKPLQPDYTSIFLDYRGERK